MTHVWEFLFSQALRQHLVQDIECLWNWLLWGHKVNGQPSQDWSSGHLIPHPIMFVLTHAAMLLFPSNRRMMRMTESSGGIFPLGLCLRVLRPVGVYAVVSQDSAKRGWSASLTITQSHFNWGESFDQYILLGEFSIINFYPWLLQFSNFHLCLTIQPGALLANPTVSHLLAT